MGGFNSVTGLETIVFADNASFDGTERNGTLKTDGQLWIGRTAAPHVVRGVIDSPDSSILVGFADPNITLSAGTAMGTVKTLTPDLDFDGTPATPISGTSGNINILSYNPSFATVTDTLNSTGAATGNLTIEHRAWLTGLVVDPSSTLGTRGTFTTITSAIAAATSGQTIFIRPGTYTENFTLKAGVNLCGFPSDGTGVNSSAFGNTIIKGKITHNTSGFCSLAALTFQTNADYCIEVSGAADSALFIVRCYFDVADHTAILHSSSGDSPIDIRYSEGEITTTGIAFLTKSAPQAFKFYWSDIRNIGSSATPSTVSAGQLAIRWSRWYHNITTSSTGVITALDSQFDNFGAAIVPLIIGGTGSQDTFKNCFVNGNSQSCCTIATGSTARFTQCCFETTTSPVISGLGTIIYSDLAFDSTGRGLTVSTQTPRNYIPGAMSVTTPGAYPYTTVSQDAVILVDSSVARTITPLASPETGQMHVIKDSVGSAASNNITITPSGKNIDGAASKTINTNYGSMTIVFNGTEWSVI